MNQTFYRQSDISQILVRHLQTNQRFCEVRVNPHDGSDHIPPKIPVKPRPKSHMFIYVHEVRN
jgi:hypothetical protein